MRDWFRRLMMGRYGVDQLTWVLLGALFGHLAMRQHFSDQGAQHPVLGGAGGVLSAHLLPQHLRPAAGEPKAAAILVEAEE